MTKKKKKAGETFVFQKPEGQSPFGAEEESKILLIWQVYEKLK